MIIFPAIDILDGNAVRLKYGDYSKVTIYGTPAEMIRKWEECGAEYVHIVDLNGARADHKTNAKTIENLANSSKLSIQVGGGIRTMSDIIRYFDCGVDRVILGSACVNNTELLQDALMRFGGDKIICGADTKNGKIATDGWLKTSDISLVDLCKQMKSMGATTVICTDIAKDGALSGTNTENISEVISNTGMNVIASGGVSTFEDIEKVKKLGAYGVILGRSLYEKRFTLEEALAAAKE